MGKVTEEMEGDGRVYVYLNGRESEGMQIEMKWKGRRVSKVDKEGNEAQKES